MSQQPRGERSAFATCHDQKAQVLWAAHCSAHSCHVLQSGWRIGLSFVMKDCSECSGTYAESATRSISLKAQSVLMEGQARAVVVVFRPAGTAWLVTVTDTNTVSNL